MKYISKTGLPLKVTAQWTDNDYYNRKIDRDGTVLDEFEVVNVAGWLIRINGYKFPRGHTDGDGNPDWTYRYTRDGKTEKGKKFAIESAIQSFENI